MKLPAFSGGQWLPRLHLLAFAAVVGLPGCIASGGGAMKPSKSKQGPSTRGIEEFFVGAGVLQYFMLPQRLEGPTARYADLDLVVRDSASRPLWGILHVSVVGPARLTPADTVLLATAAGPLMALAPAVVLFSEPTGKRQQLTRLEWRLTAGQVAAYLNSPQRTLTVAHGGTGRVAYVPGKKAAGRLTAMRQLVLGGE